MPLIRSEFVFRQQSGGRFAARSASELPDAIETVSAEPFAFRPMVIICRRSEVPRHSLSGCWKTEAISLLRCGFLPGQCQGHHGIHAVDHRRRHQDRSATLLGRFIDDIHCAQLQSGRVIGVGYGRLDELSRNRRLSRSKNYPSLLFALGLGLSRHSVLQRNRDRDVADLNGLHGDAPVRGFAADLAPQELVGCSAFR